MSWLESQPHISNVPSSAEIVARVIRRAGLNFTQALPPLSFETDNRFSTAEVATRLVQRAWEKSAHTWEFGVLRAAFMPAVILAAGFLLEQPYITPSPNEEAQIRASYEAKKLKGTPFAAIPKRPQALRR